MQASTEHPIRERRAASSEERERAEKPFQFADLSAYTLKQRLIVRAAGLLFYLVIKFASITTRFEVKGQEHWDAAFRDQVPIWVIWHDSMFLGIYFGRGRGFIVMSSKSFDAEYTARCIQRFGYGVAKGSSTRGGAGGLIEMIRLMRAGHPTAFTIDGPKGPRHVAKMGPVLLAKKTGQPIISMYIAAKHCWRAPTWDALQVPLPFTRALVCCAPLIYVPADADEAMLDAKYVEMQRALDEATRCAEEWRAAAVGS